MKNQINQYKEQLEKYEQKNQNNEEKYMLEKKNKQLEIALQENQNLMNHIEEQEKTLSTQKN